MDEIEDLKHQIEELSLAKDFCQIERDVALVQLRTETERNLWLERRMEEMRKTFGD